MYSTSFIGLLQEAYGQLVRRGPADQTYEDRHAQVSQIKSTARLPYALM